MNYNEFLKVLTPKEKKDFEKYSTARGPQAYAIILVALGENINPKKVYKNVSQIIRYDKGLKEILFRYLGYMEERIKTYIFSNYDLDPEKDDNSEYKKEKEINGKVIRQNIYDGDITNLYQKFKLDFGGIKCFLKNEKDKEYDQTLLEDMRLLRNEVMHHRTLLFDYDSKYTGDEIYEKIKSFIKLLPNNFANYLIKDLCKYTKLKKKKIEKKYHKFLLFKSEEDFIDC